MFVILCGSIPTVVRLTFRPARCGYTCTQSRIKNIISCLMLVTVVPIDSIHYLGLTNSFDQVPRDIHTLPSIIVNFLLNSLNAPITFVVCATNQS
jgi:hypothetical protein